MRFEGSHGTTAENCKKIKDEGFTAGDGRIGNGVYFWAKQYKFVELALGWCKQRVSAGRCCNGTVDSCVAIICEFSSDKDEYIDLEEEKYRIFIGELAEMRSVDTSNTNHIAKLHEYAIGEIEKKYGIHVVVVRKQVAPPKRECCPEYSIQLLGAPRCYLVRDPEIITIIDVRTIEES